MKIVRHPAFLITLLLTVFFLKGVFLATLFPIFTGQDEARHYNTLQYLNQPEIPTEQTTHRLHIQNKEDFSDYNFSEEIVNTGKTAGIDDLRHGLFDTQRFVPESFDGANESEITRQTWKPYNFTTPADVVGSKSLYHTIAGAIESTLSQQDILTRFYAIRIFSVLLGTIAVFLTFLIARSLQFDHFISTLLAALVAFQPKFSMYLTNINYDALLIPTFFLFTWGGVISIQKGLNWKNFSIMFLAVVIGLLTKGTAIVLLMAFLGIIFYHSYRFIRARHQFKITFLRSVFAALFIIGIVALSSGRYHYTTLIPIGTSFSVTATSLGQYLDKSLTFGRFGLSSRTYWGSLGWNDDFLARHFTDILWPLEEIAIVGIILFLFSKKKPNFLPEKKPVIFLIAMIIALQFGIRVADWNVFAHTGSLDLGTPGRYFLPNLATHLILVFLGIGTLLGTRERFKNILLGGVIFMCFFSMFLTLDIILPRFYL
ncbi:MAG: glycosyltransferase family 39 protein [Candidatus Moraniibacteriota bacterium]|nr:MAG: glycosyltransferase family 39 protein [Candidatus Moranbacteria bacterium]